MIPQRKNSRKNKRMNKINYRRNTMSDLDKAQDNATSGQEMNLRGQVSQQIDFIFEVLKEIDVATKKIAKNSIGWGDTPSDTAKEPGHPPDSGFLNEFLNRLKTAEGKARKTLSILNETNDQL